MGQTKCTYGCWQCGDAAASAAALPFLLLAGRSTQLICAADSIRSNEDQYQCIDQYINHGRMSMSTFFGFGRGWGCGWVPVGVP
eukprot:scaffold45382_cov59-Attheya_sp.AAC.2